MRRRGKVPKGFRSDDEKALQSEFDLEHKDFLERVKKERIGNKEKIRKQALMQHRRLLLEKQLKEEQDEAVRDHRVDFWLSLVSTSLSIIHTVCRLLHHTHSHIDSFPHFPLFRFVRMPPPMQHVLKSILFPLGQWPKPCGIIIPLLHSISHVVTLTI